MYPSASEIFGPMRASVGGVGGGTGGDRDREELVSLRDAVQRLKDEITGLRSAGVQVCALPFRRASPRTLLALAIFLLA